MVQLARYPDEARPIVSNATIWRAGPLTLTHWREDIQNSPDWEICSDGHVVIVHLDGQMDDLHTEVRHETVYEGPVLPGGVWLIPSGRRYACHAVGLVIEYATIQISPESLSGIATADDSMTGDLQPALGCQDPFLYRTIRVLLGLVRKRDDMSAMTAVAAAQMICWHLVDEYGIGGKVARRRLSPLDTTARQRMVSFIYDNLDGRIAVGDLAHVAGIPERDFFAEFYHVFGVTPAKFILRERLGRARWLLYDTKKEIVSIALETGFCSHSHLTTAFKQRYGMTPSEFRRRHS